MIATRSIIINGVLYRRGQDVGNEGNRESGKEPDSLEKEPNSLIPSFPDSLEDIEPEELPKI